MAQMYLPDGWMGRHRSGPRYEWAFESPGTINWTYTQPFDPDDRQQTLWFELDTGAKLAPFQQQNLREYNEEYNVTWFQSEWGASVGLADNPHHRVRLCNTIYLHYLQLHQ